MGIINIIFLILLWGIPTFLSVKAYLKLNKEEQAEVKRGLINPSFIFVDGFRYFGMPVFFSGIITSLAVLKHIGAFMLIIGWFSAGVEMWETSIKKSVVLISIAMLASISYYFL